METKFKIGARVRQNNVPLSLPNPILIVKGIREKQGILCYYLEDEMPYSNFNFYTPVDAGNLELVD